MLYALMDNIVSFIKFDITIEDFSNFAWDVVQESVSNGGTDKTSKNVSECSYFARGFHLHYL